MSNPLPRTALPNAPAKRGNRSKVANENLPQQQKLPEQLLGRRQQPTGDRDPGERIAVGQIEVAQSSAEQMSGVLTSSDRGGQILPCALPGLGAEAL